MTSFDIATFASEIKQTIKGARIDNIYQINYTVLLLSLRQPNHPSFNLIAESGKRIHITSYDIKKPRKPSDFCMALRKYLKNGKVTLVQQHEFERTVVMQISTREGEFQLIYELFGGGNIILVNPQNKILHALSYRKMRDRNVWRGEPFRFAPPRGRNPLKLSRQDLSVIKNLGQLEVVRALTKFLSIGGLYAEEILLRAKVDKDASCNNLTEPDIEGVFHQLHQILSRITAENAQPCIVVNDEKVWIDVTPIPLEKLAHFERKHYRTFNEALDDYYTNMGVKEGVAEVAKEVEQEIAKQNRILQSQQKALKDLRGKVKQNRKIGEIIYIHLNELGFLLQEIRNEKQRGRPWKQITFNILEQKKAGQTPAIHFDSLEPKRLILNVSLDNLDFSLDLRHSIQTNAANYYAKAKKADKKLEGLKKALRETKKKIGELQRRGVERIKEKREPPSKRRKKAWYEKFRWFHSSDGLLVVGGRDATTNEILIKRYMESHDKVFHADILGAPFVLIKTEGKSSPDQTIREAARFAAAYSRAWKEMLGTINVSCFSPKQISKSPPSGQYLKKGAFVVSGQKSYIRNVPLEVAIGIDTDGEHLRVIGGPTEAIANQTNIYVKIISGKQTSGRLAKQIQRLLNKKAPENMKKPILKIPLEEIQKFIPSGKGKVC